MNILRDRLQPAASQNIRNPNVSPEGREDHRTWSLKPGTDEGHCWVVQVVGGAAQQAPSCPLNGHH